MVQKRALIGINSLPFQTPVSGIHVIISYCQTGDYGCQVCVNQLATLHLISNCRRTQPTLIHAKLASQILCMFIPRRAKRAWGSEDYSSCLALIDWEMAGPIGQKTWWDDQGHMRERPCQG